MPQEHAMNIIEEGTEQQADSSSDDEGPVNDATDLNEEIDFDDDELFKAPDTYNSDQEDPIITDMNINDSWILLWLFKYQERFKLPDVAINSLIGFLSLLLKGVDSNRFGDFPSTAYMARKLLEIKKKLIKFAACPDCNKLYDIETIISTNTVDKKSKCSHIEFPNHLMQSQCKPCGSDLLMKVPVNRGYIWRPKMVYPLPCLKTQLLIK